MQNKPKGAFTRYLMGGTGLAMLAAMSLSAPVSAQEAAAEDDITEVIVVGARAAQQSANNRKKRAKTAQDSIIADDVGAFPDKNLNEALSRVAGVALNRDDFGDGTSIAIRGNSSENIRVELDGLGVGGGGMDVTRSADLMALPADLIKSVDVVKGSTADMTEGSLGGSVRVQTRTGLDFKKPYLSFRVGQRRNSLGQSWQPDINLIASRKFLNDRLGVIFSVTQTKVQNNTSGAENNAYGAGYQGRLDFDNSPEKTFTFNPSTVYSPDGITTPTQAADVLLANSSFTPRQIVEMSAAAGTKAECMAAFPLLTPGTGVNQSNTAARRNQRVFELQTCLGQWNDLEPQNPRNFDHTQNENRFSADIRFDYRVSDHLTVFAKYNQSNRKVDRQFRERRLGGGLGTGANPGAVWNATSNPNGVWYITNPGGPIQQRAVAPGNEEYFYYDSVGTINNLPIIGDVIGIDPATVKVDENHYVTEYTMYDQNMFIGQRWEPFETKSSYMQVGGEYRNGGLRAEFMAGKSTTDYSRIGTYSTRSFNYGSARFFQQPSGLWAHEILTPYDETDPANFVQMIPQGASAEVIGSVDAPYAPAYTVAQRPLVSQSPMAVEYNAWLSETEETTAKFDVTYNFSPDIPFITTFKSGVSYRNPEGSFWSNPNGKVIQSAQGTYHIMNGNVPARDVNGLPILNPDYVAPIILPRALIRSSIRACEPTSTSIQSCDYGFVGDTILREARDGVLTLTPAEMTQLVASTTMAPDSEFFAGYEGAEALDNWQGIDVRTLVNMLPNTNFDCMKTCTASDGKVYEQPYRKYSEKITAAYYMAEFEQELPFNMIVDGNVGLRVVQTEVEGTGELTLNYITTTASFDPAAPNVASGIQTVSYSQNVSFAKTTRDYIPSYNVGLWLIPDQLVLRYYKGKNIARPGINDLLPVGNCTIDERRTLDLSEFGEDNTCSRIGNPALKPFTAWNENISVEWYPNNDTMFSIARHKQDERIGARTTIQQTENLLAGTGLVDPVTGQPVDSVSFAYPTWGNAPGFQRDGWEFSTKTAFTFLPWYLRYTGADFNYSKLESASATVSTNALLVNPNTGEVMPPQGEAEYYANLSLWYDDGKTNARISWQARGAVFENIEGNVGGSNVRNNYPFPGSVNTRPVVYRPGNAMYVDETLYVDAKITHKLTPNVEIYAEARNVSKEARVTWNGGDEAYSDGTPYINGLYYGGRSISFGITYRN